MTDDSLQAHLAKLSKYWATISDAPGRQPQQFIRWAEVAALIVAVGPHGWRPIATAPKRRKVIVSWINAFGKRRTTFAVYYDAGELDMEDEYPGEIDEEGHNAEAGWFEDREAGEPSYWELAEPLTHWMPLPEPPSAALLVDVEPQADAMGSSLKDAAKYLESIISAIHSESANLDLVLDDANAAYAEVTDVLAARVGVEPPTQCPDTEATTTASIVTFLRGMGYDDAANTLAELHVEDCALRGVKPLVYCVAVAEPLVYRVAGEDSTDHQLATEIVECARRLGIADGSQPLTGPELLLLLQDVEAAARVGVPRAREDGDCPLGPNHAHRWSLSDGQ